MDAPLEFEGKWARLGLVIGLANLLFIAMVVILLEYDLLLGITFAIVASVIGGIAVTIYALRLA